MGANVLTHLLGQSVDEVAAKITIYHAALRAAGHDPANHAVTLLLHTYIAPTREAARDVAHAPMKAYLRAAAGLIKTYAWAFPAFKKPQGMANPMDIDLGSLAPKELDAILDFAFQRYFDDSGLFGTVDDALARVARWRVIWAAMNDDARAALGTLQCLLIDSEALPGALVTDLRSATDARILNMYGPTETTI